MNRYLKDLLGSEQFDCPEDQIGYLSEKKTAYIDYVRKLSGTAIKGACVLGLALVGGGASMLFNSGEPSLVEFGTFSGLGAGWGVVVGNSIYDKAINRVVGKAYEKFDKEASTELGYEVSIPVRIKQEDIDNYERSDDVLPGIYNPSNYIDCDEDSMN